MTGRAPNRFLFELNEQASQLKTVDTEQAFYNALQWILTSHDDLLEALEELVDLKAEKDLHGADDVYLKRKPIAWAKAAAAIAKATP